MTVSELAELLLNVAYATAWIWAPTVVAGVVYMHYEDKLLASTRENEEDR